MNTTPDDSGRPRLVYRLCHRDEWRAAVRAGAFSGGAHDARDGFIHLSAAAQVEETARRHYAGVRPLMLLAVDTARVVGDMRWEPSRGGALFPHLYGAIPMESVVSTLPLSEDRDGHPIIPPLSNSPGDLAP